MSAQTNIRSSTQDHLSIEDVQDNLVILKNGSCALILKTTAVNFGLLSEREQEATIFAYAAFLNSLAFSIQILIHSRQKDISFYLALIDEQIQKQPDETLRARTQQYRQFVESTVKKNKVLDKKFYLIVPFNSIQFKKTQKQALLEKAKTDLYPKRDHLIGQLQRLGLKAVQLTDKEIIELLHNIYNPVVEGQGFTSSADYSGSLVQSNLKPASLPETPPPPPTNLNNPRAARPVNTLVPPAPSTKIEQPRGQKLQQTIKNIVEKVQQEKHDTTQTKQA